jgi:excisionase family DNA binding protein
MSAESKDTLTIALTGVLTISRNDLEQLLARLVPTKPVPTPKVPAGEAKPAHMSYSVKETAELLGISGGTVYRLLKLGLLRSSSALRTKVIPKSEIERFGSLKESVGKWRLG